MRAVLQGGGRQARVSPFPRTELGAIPAFEPAEGLFPPLRSARRVLGRNGGSRLPRTCGSEMVKTCCALRRKGPQDAWTACKGCAPHQISGEEAKKAIVFALKDRAAEQRRFEADSDDKYWVCAECAVLSLRACLSPHNFDATGKQNIKSQDVVNDVLVIAGVKDSRRKDRRKSGEKKRTSEEIYDECVREVAAEKEKKKGPAAVQALAERPPSRASAKATPSKSNETEDELDILFRLARPLIPDISFFRSEIITGCRVLLWKKKGYEGIGRSPWDDHFHGQAVLRFWAGLYPFLSQSLCKELAGPPTPKGEAWSASEKNLIWMPTDKTLREYMGTPYSLVSVLTVHQQLLVDSLALIRHGSGVQRPSVFITFDKVHVNKQGDIIYDGGKPFFVGGLTRTDLTGALRSYAELRRVSKVDESDLADGFLTVVLHDEAKTITHGCLIGVIPIGAETKEFIYAMVLKYADLSFDANARLVHGSGDGHAANISRCRGWRRQTQRWSGAFVRWRLRER